MKIYEYGKDEIAATPCAMALGMFDGVHTAHRELIKMAKERAAELSLPLGVFTFGSEGEIKSGVGRIYSTEQRLTILKELGVDFCVLSDFSKIRNMSAREFCLGTLTRELGCKLCAAGYNFRFGKGASADVTELRSIMGEVGCEVLVLEEMRIGDKEISSSAIRELLQNGNVSEAGKLLGEPYFAIGYVTHGRGVGGSRLGFPTVNIAFGENALIPRLGVYTASAVVGGIPHPAIANVGVCPTLGERRVHIEAHLLNFHSDLYGQHIRINLLSFLRDEKRFDSEEELKMQIKADISAVIDNNRGAK